MSQLKKSKIIKSKNQRTSKIHNVFILFSFSKALTGRKAFNSFTNTMLEKIHMFLQKHEIVVCLRERFFFYMSLTYNDKSSCESCANNNNSKMERKKNIEDSLAQY